MKAGTIPFPRQFTVGASGLDCRAVKVALDVAEHGAHGMSVKTNSFAKTAGATLAMFKKSHGLLADPIYTAEAHAKLQPFFTPQAATWMVEVAGKLSSARQRAAYVETWRWMIAHPALFDYTESRPIPETLTPFQTTKVIRTDCSGTVELAAAWTHLPDPSGLDFDGAGNTGSLLAHCTHITQAQARPADLIVYRDSLNDTYGHHVVAILGCHPGNTDFDCGSNGSNPIREIAHSLELASQARNGHGTATFLRWLP